MKFFFRYLVVTFIIQVFVSSCKAESSSYKKEIKHMQDYYLSDQTERNESMKNQAFDDLRGCPILIDMSGWYYDTRWSKGTWMRDQSWMYSDRMVSEIGTGISNEDFINPPNVITIYTGPWKEVNLERGFLWNKVKFKKHIRFVARQKKNDVLKGYIYSGYEFLTENNQNIPEQPITLDKDLPSPAFETFCQVKWTAKYGYNAIYDQKTKKIIQAKE